MSPSQLLKARRETNMYRGSAVIAILVLACATEISSYSTLNKVGCLDKMSVTCPCLKSKLQQFVNVSVNACPMHYKGDLGTRCEPCQDAAAAACKAFSNCRSCIATKDGPVCLKPDKKLFNQTKSFPSGYPIVVKMPPGGHKGMSARLQRDVDGCDHHFGFDTAEVTCWIWPDHVKCEEICIHGFEIDGKTTRRSKCKSKDPHFWYPVKLEECKEAVNCHPMLVSPGYLKCYTHTMHPPHCSITCEAYDGRPASSRRSYHCSHTFDPPLPHCAKLNPNFDVVKEKEVSGKHHHEKHHNEEKHHHHGEKGHNEEKHHHHGEKGHNEEKHHHHGHEGHK